MQMVAKNFLFCLSLFVLIVSCTIFKDLIPVNSDNYSIEKTTIIYSDTSYSIKVKGKYSRPVKYKQVVKFKLEVVSYTDTLHFYYNRIQVVAVDYQKKFTFTDFSSGRLKKNEQQIIIPPNKKGKISLYYFLEDKSLVMPYNHVQNIVMEINSFQFRDGTSIKIPNFSFVADST